MRACLLVAAIHVDNQVEVSVTDHGLGPLEVSDNGTGISADNYASIALKHFTSKLSDFSELEAVMSYGFRGEVRRQSPLALFDHSTPPTATATAAVAAAAARAAATAVAAASTTTTNSPHQPPIAPPFTPLHAHTARTHARTRTHAHAPGPLVAVRRVQGAGGDDAH